MSKKLKLLLIILIPIICLIIAGIPFTLADYPETQTEQTMTGTSAEDTGASAADKSFKGGALYISNGASYTMTGGSIAGKDNQYGGAVYVTNGSTFIMTGGTITGCSALYGGAIYVEAGGTCNITGGTITGNKAQFAPAIYVEDGGILNVDQTAVIKDNEYGKYGNALEIYVDGVLVKTMYMKADTYTINEADMPLQYENCCGYFLDEKLSQCSFGEIALTSEAMGFAPRTADAENYVARLYTRTADPNNFTFIFNSTTQTYDIKAKNTSISGHIVFPKEYENVQTSLYYGSGNGAFFGCRSMTSITFQEGLTQITAYAFDGLNNLTGGLVLPNSVTYVGYQSFGSCSGLTGNLIIPNSIERIGYFAFSGCTGLSGRLIIPEGVTRIDEWAFSGCSGFIGELIIPESVETLGIAFRGCSGITSVRVLSGNAGYEDRGKNAIIQKSTNKIMQGFNCTDLSVLEEVSGIAQQAFYGCSELTGNVIIGNNVTSIGEDAFRGCSGLTGSLIIGEATTSIGNYAFDGCRGFSSVSVASGNSVFNDKNGKNAIVETRTDTLILGFNCTDLSILEEVTIIGEDAFYYCTGLTGDLIIGGSVKTIYSGAFQGCAGITKAYISNSVTTINASRYGESPFFNCANSLVIYTDVANVESKPSGWGGYWNYSGYSSPLQVVYGCSLDADGNIIEPASINIYVDGASTPTKVLTPGGTSYTVVESDMPLDYESCCGYFYDEILMTTIKNNTIDLTKGDVNLYTRTADPSLFTFTTDGANGYIITKNSAVTYSGTEFNLIMPREYENKTVTTIAEKAFRGGFGGCGVVCVVLSSEITKILDKGFDSDDENPSCIQEINIHDKITTIGDDAFYHCLGNMELILPESLISIGDSAFFYCDGLIGDLIISNSVTSIGKNAFSFCRGLKSVIIGNSVTSIGEYAFQYCIGLTSVYIPSCVTTISAPVNSPFSSCSSSLVIYTDVANASSIPSGWGTYWNYKSSSETYTTNYGYTLEQYKSAVGIATFTAEVEKIEVEDGAVLEVDVQEEVLFFQKDKRFNLLVSNKLIA